jgi:uncharacterized protein YacL
MKTMKSLRYSIKSEPIWMLVFSLGPAVVGLLVALFVMLVLKHGR